MDAAGSQTPAPNNLGAVIEDLQNEYDRSAQFLNKLLQSLVETHPRGRSDDSGPLEQLRNMNEEGGDDGIQVGRIDEENEAAEEDIFMGLSQQRTPDPDADSRDSKQKKPSSSPVRPLRLPKQAGAAAPGTARGSPHPPSTGRASPHPAGAVSPARRRPSLDVKSNEIPAADRGARRSVDGDSLNARKGWPPLPPAGGKQPLPKAVAPKDAPAAMQRTGKEPAAAAVAGGRDAGGSSSGAAHFGRRLLSLFGGGGGGKSSSVAATAATQPQQQPKPPQTHISAGCIEEASAHGASGGDSSQLLRTLSGSGHTQWSRREAMPATDVSGSQLAHTLTADTSLPTSQHYDKLHSSELSGSTAPTPGSASIAGVPAAAQHRAPAAMASPDAAGKAGSDQSKGARLLHSGSRVNQRQPNTPLLAPGSGLPATATAPAYGLPWSGSFTSSSAAALLSPSMHAAAAGASAVAWPAQNPAVPQPLSLAEVLAAAEAEAQLPLRGGGRGGRQRRSSLDFTPALPAHLRASLDSSGLPSLTALGAAQEVARLRSSLATPLTVGASGARARSFSPAGSAGRVRPSLELFGGIAPTGALRGETRTGGGLGVSGVGGVDGGHTAPLHAAPAYLQPAVQRAPGGLQGSMAPPQQPSPAAAAAGWGTGSYSAGQLVLVGELEGPDAGASVRAATAASGASRGVHIAAASGASRSSGSGSGSRFGGWGAAAARYQTPVAAPANATWAAAEEATAAGPGSAPLPVMTGVRAAAPPTIKPAAAVSSPPYGGASAVAGSPFVGWRLRAPTSADEALLPCLGAAGAAATMQPHHGLQQHGHGHGHGAELPCVRSAGGHAAAIALSASGEAPPLQPQAHCTSTLGATNDVRHSRDFGLAARQVTPMRSGGSASGPRLVLASSLGGGGPGSGGGGSVHKSVVTLHPAADALLATMQTLHGHQHQSQPNLAGSGSHAFPPSPSRFASCPATYGANATAAAAVAAASGDEGGGSSSGGGRGTTGPVPASMPVPALAAAAAAEAPAAGAAWASGGVSSLPSGTCADAMAMEREAHMGEDSGPAGRGARRSEVGEAAQAAWAPRVPALATLHPLQAEPITGIAGRAALVPSAPGVGVAALRREAAVRQDGLGGGDVGDVVDYVGRGRVSEASSQDGLVLLMAD